MKTEITFDNNELCTAVMKRMREKGWQLFSMHTTLEQKEVTDKNVTYEASMQLIPHLHGEPRGRIEFEEALKQATKEIVTLGIGKIAEAFRSGQIDHPTDGQPHSENTSVGQEESHTPPTQKT